MDIRVQEILERIKQAGVNEARVKADAVLAEAEAKKAELLAEAEKQAALIVSKAKEEARRTEAAARTALVQASRDLVSSFKAQILGLTGTIIAERTKDAYTIDVLKKAIPAVLETISKETSGNPALLVTEKDGLALEAFIRSELASKVKQGLEIRPVKNLSAGFRIGEKDGSAYYDCSADALAELFGAFINDKLKSVMDEAVK